MLTLLDPCSNLISILTHLVFFAWDRIGTLNCVRFVMECELVVKSVLLFCVLHFFSDEDSV